MGQRDTFLHIGTLLSIVFEVSAQENTSLQNILGNLATYIESTPPEKVYVQTDKDVYTKGETIWFKTYVLNGMAHTPSTLSKVVYVELVDSQDKIIAHQKPNAEFSGAAGDITIPKEIDENTYVLRVEGITNDGRPVNGFYGFNVLN